LIRKTMLQAADAANRSPRELSFTHATQTIAASLGNLPLFDDATVERLIASQLASLTEQLRAAPRHHGLNNPLASNHGPPSPRALPPQLVASQAEVPFGSDPAQPLACTHSSAAVAKVQTRVPCSFSYDSISSNTVDSISSQIGS
jgi:hypothetical protein